MYCLYKTNAGISSHLKPTTRAEFIVGHDILKTATKIAGLKQQ